MSSKQDNKQIIAIWQYGDKVLVSSNDLLNPITSKDDADKAKKKLKEFFSFPTEPIRLIVIEGKVLDIYD